MASAAVKHRVVQVTKSNFPSVLQQIKTHIHDSDFIAISTRRTGDFSASSPSSSHRHPWRRVLPFDTLETAYRKAKHAAETFEIFQFAVCPFRLRGSKVVAHPHRTCTLTRKHLARAMKKSRYWDMSRIRYNFHLFPRDELNIGMSSYSFSCQTSFLTSMAREGFNFNDCIYNGISYLSRARESTAKCRNLVPRIHPVASSPSPSVADLIFMGRIKSRVEHWWEACKDPRKETDGCLVKSLRKIILGGELYGSRPCLSIDVSSDRQVQLVVEMVNQIRDDLVPLVVPDKGGEPKSVHVVLTCSDEDKNLLMREIQTMEEEQDLKVRGFREVIDVISRSHKPVIAYDCLHDFTFIHSKLIGPLPPNMAEFMCSMKLAFSSILDINHLLNEIGPLRKANSLPAALSYLKRQFFAPVEMEIPSQVDEGSNENHGHNVLQITKLFAKLHKLLKFAPDHQTSLDARQISDYANIFYPCASHQRPGEEDINDEDIILLNKANKVSTENIVLLWGFSCSFSASSLKQQLQGTHPLFQEEFELQLADRTCAIVVSRSAGSVMTLLRDIKSGNVGSGALREMVSDGLKMAGYETYREVCRMGLWNAGLADSLEKVLLEQMDETSTSYAKDPAEIYWSSELMIDLNEL